MKVYVVEVGGMDSSFQVLGVYSTCEKAEEAIKKVDIKDRLDYCECHSHICWTEIELDADPLPESE